jgi:ATP-binding cassette subfamily B protein
MNVNRETLRIYWHHATRYKALLIGALVSLPLVIVLQQVLPPIVVANVLDRLSTGDFIAGDVFGSFGQSLFVYFVLFIGGSVVGWRIIVYFLWTLEIKVHKDLTERMHGHLMSLDMEYHNNSFGGSIVSRTNKFVNAYTRLIDTLIFDILTIITIAAATGIILWSRAPQFVVVFYVITIIYIIVTTWLTKRIRELSSLEAAKQNKVTGYLADMITNVLAVKSFSAAKNESDRFATATTDVANTSTRLKWTQLNRDAAFSFTTGMLGVVALGMAIVSVVVYEANIGTVFLVLSFSTNMSRRLHEFSHKTLRNINKSLGDAEEGTMTLLRRPTIIDPKYPLLMDTSKGNVSFKNVTFAHNKHGLYHNFSLDIPSGQKIGLVGRSGAGKTTLVKLLLRFTDIDSGKITINNIDIREVTQSDLRSSMTYVPQEPLLFHRTLEENILYGKPSATTQQLMKASQDAHAEEFIDNLDNKYKTLVGERGVKLSGGQKQRVAIARAMLKDAPILLLDEATSALDSESEQLIQDALWKLMEGKTAIVIAHRLSTIQKMDRIIVLEDGKIIEDGTHKDLLKKKGQYAKLWTHQSGGFLQD